MNWVIAGGETGPRAREMKKEWVLKLMETCQELGIPFFFKRWGTGRGHLIDGKEVREFPAEVCR